MSNSESAKGNNNSWSGQVTHYKEDIYGSRAEVYRMGVNTYSIAYFNSNDAMLRTKHFTNSTLDSIEDKAENWALGEDTWWHKN